MRFLHSVVIPLLVAGVAAKSTLRQRDDLNKAVGAIEGIETVENIENIEAIENIENVGAIEAVENEVS